MRIMIVRHVVIDGIRTDTEIIYEIEADIYCESMKEELAVATTVGVVAGIVLSIDKEIEDLDGSAF